MSSMFSNSIVILFIASLINNINGECCYTKNNDHVSLERYRSPTIYRFPWTAKIYQFNAYRASGVIISNRHILATASNILPYKGVPVETKDIGDSLEKHFWIKYTKISLKSRNRMQLEYVYIHPNYNHITYDNNIAIIEVKGFITFEDYIQPAVLPKSPANFHGKKLHIAIPYAASEGGTQLLRYNASLLSEDDCARVSGNTNSLANTLLCVDSLCSDSLCNKLYFRDPIFSITENDSIEIIGLPLWRKKSISVYNASKMCFEDRNATVYIRIVDFLAWIDEILSKRCGCHLQQSLDCGEPMFFCESCGNYLKINPII
ncbi:ovochymase-2-like [Sitodiplosis mosellana]|uniref:ovochymase-2-like n=1 Tax=Sitodiplosis mosellana TaxID=263140 RepID=UPI002445174E|nr:ovochymase-2-like [Sitodiplosis mosellana]